MWSISDRIFGAFFSRGYFTLVTFLPLVFFFCRTKANQLESFGKSITDERWPKMEHDGFSHVRLRCMW